MSMADDPSIFIVHFSALQERLCALFRVPVNLVESSPIRSYYFHAEAEKIRMPRYPAV